MNCTKTRRQLDMYMDSELSVPENMEVLEHLNLCRTCQDVFQIVRDYIACVLPSELLKMPASSQAAIADAATDVAGAAVTLRRDELQFRGDDETAALLQQMSQTLTAASSRLAHLDGAAVEVETASGAAD